MKFVLFLRQYRELLIWSGRESFLQMTESNKLKLTALETFCYLFSLREYAAPSNAAFTLPLKIFLSLIMKTICTM